MIVRLALFQIGRGKLLAEGGTCRCVVSACFDFLFGFLGNKWGGKSFSQRAATSKEKPMRKLAITLLAGAGALCAGSAANATDIYSSSEYSNSDLVQQVRLVCNEDGQCYRTRGGSRVIVRDSYNYAPRERYIERRTYRDWDDGPRAGVGFRAPGVSVGVGVDNDRW